ncbi:unnamed protein product [Calicophoron daubneyi]|uniref:Uncharacterized protein n=1 Tax=Calicophoron daubneyi TaxID=300641 RepID=A0AAV2TYS8_CALDB
MRSHFCILLFCVVLIHTQWACGRSLWRDSPYTSDEEATGEPNYREASDEPLEVNYKPYSLLDLLQTKQPQKSYLVRKRPYYG